MTSDFLSLATYLTFWNCFRHMIVMWAKWDNLGDTQGKAIKIPVVLVDQKIVCCWRQWWAFHFFYIREGALWMVPDLEKQRVTVTLSHTVANNPEVFWCCGLWQDRGSNQEAGTGTRWCHHRGLEQKAGLGSCLCRVTVATAKYI